MTLTVAQMARKARVASIAISRLNTDQKNDILSRMAVLLDENRADVLTENQKDVVQAQAAGLSPASLDRLILNDTRINQIVASLQTLISLRDYVGDITDSRDLYNGLKLQEKRVGFGVIGVIYESRPNVTFDVGSICLKSASAVLLKGGKEALNTNRILVRLLQAACPVPNAFQLIESSDRSVLGEMLTLSGSIDLIIPRGGAGLISFVRDNSRVPVIETGTGNCHIFVDDTAVQEQVIPIILNAKTQRPSVCNAVETVLIHSAVADQILPKLLPALSEAGVEVRGCEVTRTFSDVIAATPTDWATEFLDLILAVKVVPDLAAAIAHINQYGSRHSESILSQTDDHIVQFQTEVDAAVVYANASTRFTDGGEFGLGAEIGISTQKLHARGPMGLKALTTVKYLVNGTGQVRSD